MLKIWGRDTPRPTCRRCCGAAPSSASTFERVDLGGPFGGNHDPEYLAINPNGLVPTVRTATWSCGNRTRSAAISRRPAAASGSIPRDPAARTLVERWMDWQLSVVGAADGAVAVRPGPDQARAARPGGDRGGAAPGARRLDDRRGASSATALSRRRRAEPRRNRARNPGLSLVHLPDRTAGACPTSGPGTTGCASGPASRRISKSRSRDREPGWRDVVLSRAVVSLREPGPAGTGRRDEIIPQALAVCCGGGRPVDRRRRHGAGQGGGDQEPRGADEGAEQGSRQRQGVPRRKGRAGRGPGGGGRARSDHEEDPRHVPAGNCRPRPNRQIGPPSRRCGATGTSSSRRATPPPPRSRCSSPPSRRATRPRIQTAFGDLGKNGCGGCHTAFREKLKN